MSDPLSVAASVVGLVTISAQIYTMVNKFVSTVKDAPSFARTVSSEVNAFYGCVCSFQALLSTAAFQPARGELLSARNVITTLADAVLILDEIGQEVAPLALVQTTDMSVVERARWTRKKARLLELEERLHRCTGSLTLQVNILQWYVSAIRCHVTLVADQYHL